MMSVGQQLDLEYHNDLEFGESKTAGRWTTEEHMLFLQGLQQYQKQWKSIADLVKTRTVVQIRTHAQKYFQKLDKSGGTQKGVKPDESGTSSMEMTSSSEGDESRFGAYRANSISSVDSADSHTKMHRSTSVGSECGGYTDSDMDKGYRMTGASVYGYNGSGSSSSCPGEQLILKLSTSRSDLQASARARSSTMNDQMPSLLSDISLGAAPKKRSRDSAARAAQAVQGAEPPVKSPKRSYSKHSSAKNAPAAPLQPVALDEKYRGSYLDFPAFAPSLLSSSGGPMPFVNCSNNSTYSISNSNSTYAINNNSNSSFFYPAGPYSMGGCGLAASAPQSGLTSGSDSHDWREEELDMLQLLEKIDWNAPEAAPPSPSPLAHLLLDYETLHGGQGRGTSAGASPFTDSAASLASRGERPVGGTAFCTVPRCTSSSPLQLAAPAGLDDSFSVFDDLFMQEDAPPPPLPLQAAPLSAGPVGDAAVSAFASAVQQQLVQQRHQQKEGLGSPHRSSIAEVNRRYSETTAALLEAQQAASQSLPRVWFSSVISELRGVADNVYSQAAADHDASLRPSYVRPLSRSGEVVALLPPLSSLASAAPPVIVSSSLTPLNSAFCHFAPMHYRGDGSGEGAALDGVPPSAEQFMGDDGTGRPLLVSSGGVTLEGRGRTDSGDLVTPKFGLALPHEALQATPGAMSPAAKKRGRPKKQLGASPKVTASKSCGSLSAPASMTAMSGIGLQPQQPVFITGHPSFPQLHHALPQVQQAQQHDFEEFLAQLSEEPPTFGAASLPSPPSLRRACSASSAQACTAAFVRSMSMDQTHLGMAHLACFAPPPSSGAPLYPNPFQFDGLPAGDGDDEGPLLAGVDALGAGASFGHPSHSAVQQQQEEEDDAMYLDLLGAVFE